MANPANETPTIKPSNPTIAERAATGRAARKRSPRQSHGAWVAPADRADPIAVLEGQAVERVPELVPIRYGRMLASPFAFYRGAAAIMTADLASTSPTTGLTVQLCGDAHLSNFGVFGSPERRLVFDLNDFDETLPGPFEWDLKRLVASAEIASRENGYSPKQRRMIVAGTVQEYRSAMQQFAVQPHLAVWYASLDVDSILSGVGAHLQADARLNKALARARTRDSAQAYAKLAGTVDGRPRIHAVPPLIVPIEDLVPSGEAQTIYDQLAALVEQYGATLQADRRWLLSGYDLVHVARKVVGVGSVGTRAWILLLQGADDRDPLFLQAKEASASVLEAELQPSQYANHGERVVTGQRLMQAASDIFLGWVHTTGMDGRPRDFYVRQLRDWKGSVVVETMSADRMQAYTRLCGWTLARAHARTGDRVAIAAYLGAKPVLVDALCEFATTYADQNERDHAALRAAVDSGRVEAVTGL